MLFYPANLTIATTQTLLVLVEKEAHVVDGELAHAAAVSPDRAVKHKLLFLLQSQNAFFDGVLDDEARGVDGLVLPDAVRAVDRLHLRRGVPPGVYNFNYRIK